MKKYSIQVASLAAVSAFALVVFGACENQPSRVEQRKQEIRQRDSIELSNAHAELREADSIVAFKEFELEDMKRGFVFEKQAKYQTTGNYVLPQHSGNKSGLSFFPEVEETGKLLFVNIDRQRQYSFVEVDVTKGDYEKLLPKGVSQKDRDAVKKCFVLASLMSELRLAKEKKEKSELKVKFYEKKKEKLAD